uniref:Uncharacterized protein n=1 Tax=Avena sativa TaxID=4498 RepID=A0ACD5U8N5_AVESA
MASKQVLLLAVAAITVVSLVAQASAKDFMVGDSAGWTLNYPSGWTNGKNFTTGDSLVFTYAAGKHTVVEVTGAGFKDCDATGNAVLGSWSSGSDTVKLDKAGRRWFVCSVGNHCSQGMKLLVVTSGDSKASSASLNYNVGAGAAALVAGAAAALMF